MSAVPEKSERHLLKPFIALLILLAVLAAAGCGSHESSSAEIFYVIAPQANLRDRVAAVYNKVGIVRNGDRVEALDRQKRFIKVRTAAGIEGWLEQRYLVPQTVFVQFQTLYNYAASKPVQSKAVLRNDFRLHVTPGKNTDKLFLLPENTKVELIERASVRKDGLPMPGGAASKPATAAPEEKADEPAEKKVEEKEEAEPAKPVSGTKTAPLASGATSANEKSAAAPEKKAKAGEKEREKKLAALAPDIPMEDWWLILDSQQHAGWVPGRQLDVDIPLDVAQYAEGQRIVADFILETVHDEERQDGPKDVAIYLVLLTPPKDGLPFDFDQVRVFTWNLKRHRYETAYRDRNIFGVLPVSTGKEDFGKDGVLPTFTIHVKDDAGQVVEQKYRLMYPIVRRVLAPGEEPVRAAKAQATHKKEERRRRRR